MSSRMMAAMHYIPEVEPGDAPYEDRLIAAYIEVINTASPEAITKAISYDGHFDADDFGVDHQAFHDQCGRAAAQFAKIPSAVAGARKWLIELTVTVLTKRRNSVAERKINGRWVAIYGGVTGGWPFDEWPTVQGLEVLMGVEEQSPAYIDIVADGACGAMEATAGNPAQAEWIRNNPAEVRRMVLEAAEPSELVIGNIEADIRACVISQIAGKLDEARAV